MATISENLLRIKNIKNDIKQALIEKLSEPEGDFTTYADAIRNIGNGFRIKNGVLMLDKTNDEVVIGPDNVVSAIKVGEDVVWSSK